jgi:hypothetical protein
MLSNSLRVALSFVTVRGCCKLPPPLSALFAYLFPIVMSCRGASVGTAFRSKSPMLTGASIITADLPGWTDRVGSKAGPFAVIQFGRIVFEWCFSSC